jgi:hypothetical protein
MTDHDHEAIDRLIERPFSLTKGIFMDERAHLETLLNALDASPRALRRDGCGDWPSTASTASSLSDSIAVATDESSRRWNNVKKRLSFCRIT